MPIAVHEAGPLFWRSLAHKNSYATTESLFLRLLGLVYLAAFASLLPQILGLIGSHGIVPAVSALRGLQSELGTQGFWLAPSIFWLGISDSVLLATCIVGCLSAVALVFAPAGVRLCAFLCWVLYLSLVSVGSPFLTFQWDALLLESGFLALFSGAPFLVWAYRFLLFRLMFQSGIIKLLSGDLNWQNLHALRFHFLTQPLPNPVAYYAYRLPAPLLDFCTALALGIEFIAPFLLLGPRRVRQAGTALLALLQIAIFITGNYAFFNLLSLALCLWGLDDETLSGWKSLGRVRSLIPPLGDRWKVAARATASAILIAYIGLGFGEVALMLRSDPGSAIRSTLRALSPFEIVNTYGLFAVMTTTRPEIIIEGSNDQETWREYSFRYKPGDVHRSLPLIAPYHPRLDWQMWFAALGTYTENPWVSGLMYRILVGDPVVLHLMEKAPFTKPPRYLRAVLYDYQFTMPKDRRKTGAVWQRKQQTIWFGPVSLTGR